MMKRYLTRFFSFAVTSIARITTTSVKKEKREEKNPRKDT